DEARARGGQDDELQKADDDCHEPRDETAKAGAKDERADTGEVIDQAKLEVRKGKQQDHRDESEGRGQLRSEQRRDLALRDDYGERAEEDGRVDARPRALA